MIGAAARQAMMRDSAGQRQSQVRRQRAKTGGGELQQVARSQARPMNLFASPGAAARGPAALSAAAQPSEHHVPGRRRAQQSAGTDDDRRGPAPPVPGH